MAYQRCLRETRNGCGGCESEKGHCTARWGREGGSWKQHDGPSLSLFAESAGNANLFVSITSHFSSRRFRPLGPSTFASSPRRPRVAERARWVLHTDHPHLPQVLLCRVAQIGWLELALALAQVLRFCTVYFISFYFYLVPRLLPRMLCVWYKDASFGVLFFVDMVGSPKVCNLVVGLDDWDPNLIFWF